MSSDHEGTGGSQPDVGGRVKRRRRRRALRVPVDEAPRPAQEAADTSAPEATTAPKRESVSPESTKPIRKRRRRVSEPEDHDSTESQTVQSPARKRQPTLRRNGSLTPESSAGEGAVDLAPDLDTDLDAATHPDPNEEEFLAAPTTIDPPRMSHEVVSASATVAVGDQRPVVRAPSQKRHISEPPPGLEEGRSSLEPEPPPDEEAERTSQEPPESIDALGSTLPPEGDVEDEAEPQESASEPDSAPIPDPAPTEPEESNPSLEVELPFQDEDAERLSSPDLLEIQPLKEDESGGKPPPPPPASPPPKPATTEPKPPVARPWFEGFFDQDYLRTVPPSTPRQVARECDFIEARLGLEPGAKVLDVGCGLGLHSVELAQRGYEVVGIDTSSAMLKQALAESEDRGGGAEFLEKDMRELDFTNEFDAVLSWHTSFGYFDDDTNRAVLGGMYDALKPGGRLLIDVVNRDHGLQEHPNLVWFEGDDCVCMEETSFNYIASRLQVKRTVILQDSRQLLHNYSLRLYSLHELGQLLHFRGFRVAEVSGGESTPGAFMGCYSPRMIILAERRMNSVEPGANIPSADEPEPSS